MLKLTQIPKEIIFNKTFFIRVNFDDTHFDLNEEIDDTRMHMAKTTIEYLSTHGGKLVLFNHIGRPNGKILPHLRTDQVTQAFSLLLKRPIVKIEGETKKDGAFQLVGNEAKKAVERMKPGDIVMLENTRFDLRETSKNKKERIALAKDILSLAPIDEAIFVLDGFPISHRNNTASITEIAEFVPGIKGHWHETEEKLHDDFLKLLDSRNKHDRLTAIFGGNKIDKQFEISLFSSRHLRKGDYLILSGKSPEELLDEKTERVLERKGIIIVRPKDYALDKKDIGAKTIEEIKKIIQDTDILFWEGPVGKFEEKPFHKGGHKIINHVIELIKHKKGKLRRAFITGGELGWMTKTALNWKHKHIHSVKGFTISTGGGASIAYLANNGKAVATKYLRGWKKI